MVQKTAQAPTISTRSQEQPKTSRYRELRAELTYIGTIFLSTRIVLTLVGIIAHATLEPGYGKQFSWSKYQWLDLWGVWDSFWYMNIVQEGYSTASAIPGSAGQTNFPFFPMYPLLMKGVGEVIGDRYFLAGLFVSNICLLVSAYLLYQLVKAERPETTYTKTTSTETASKAAASKTARRSVKFLFLFPISFIFSGLFTESLYLCLMLICFYYAKRRRWLVVGIAGACLSATRTLGVLIILPMAFEYLRSIDFTWRSIDLNKFRARQDVFYLLLIPVGLLCFGLYSYQVTGDFFYFKTNQAAWGREILNPAVVLVKALVEGVKTGDAKILLELTFTLVALIFPTVFYKKIGFAYWLLCMYSVLIPLAAGIDSMARYTLPLFPLFIIFGKLSKNETWNDVLTLVFGLLQGALMIYWCTGRSLIV